jgi:serine/threonine-protein kinase
MSENPVTCDYDLLRLSLDDRLSEKQEELLARHLAECDICQRELERLAGRQKDWSKVSLALQQEAESSQSSRRVARDGRPHVERGEYTADDSTADFAVDFLEPPSSPEAIGRLGDIDILEVIGRGGMGVVLKGYQPELKRLVAVKVLASHLAVSGPARQRFAREAQAAAAILHPNVMPIFTVHSGGKVPYLVMPLLAGESLQQRITRNGPLNLVDVLRIGMQAAQGLAAAHAQGVVHRDVKPSNILLEKGVDRVMLSDFGLARTIDDASITRTGLIAGTPQYMSPEQVRGESLDARSDLFSLGSVLYTMATGRPPFRAESTYGILRRITDAAPRPIREINPDIPAWLTAIVDRLLAKRPADRFSSAEEAAVLLEQCLAHVQHPTVTHLPKFHGSRSQRHWLTRWWLAITGGLAAMALLASLVLQLRTDGRPFSADPIPPKSPVESSPPQDNPAIPWDAAAKQQDQLDYDAVPFESRVDRLWDRLPVPMSQDSSPNFNVPLDARRYRTNRSTCAAVGWTCNVIEWQRDPPGGFGCLGFKFWNWPRFNRPFLEEFLRRLRLEHARGGTAPTAKAAEVSFASITVRVVRTHPRPFCRLSVNG